MALPLAPIALLALRYGAVAAATYAVVKRAQNAEQKDLRSEHVTTPVRLMPVLATNARSALASQVRALKSTPLLWGVSKSNGLNNQT